MLLSLIDHICTCQLWLSSDQDISWQYLGRKDISNILFFENGQQRIFEEGDGSIPLPVNSPSESSQPTLQKPPNTDSQQRPEGIPDL